jgi:hypothetical protein
MTDNDNQGMIERELTPIEIEERTKQNLDLQGKRDDNLIEIGEKRRQIRMLVAANKRLELQSSEVRREIRTGKVFESRQGLLPLDEPPARHGEGALVDPVELRHMITCVRPREFWPTVKQVATWHEQVRADVQRWCRAEHARAHPIAGAPLPPAFAMPNVLENIALELEESERIKRKASKAAARAAKVRPASGTPLRTGQGRKPARGRKA